MLFSQSERGRKPNIILCNASTFTIPTTSLYILSISIGFDCKPNNYNHQVQSDPKQTTRQSGDGRKSPMAEEAFDVHPCDQPLTSLPLLMLNPFAQSYIQLNRLHSTYGHNRPTSTSSFQQKQQPLFKSICVIFNHCRFPVIRL